MEETKTRRNVRTKAPLEPADTCYIGLDEAGYGPNIGPLVVASTAFVGPRSLANADWWKELKSAVGRASAKKQLCIDDSKAILSLSNGRHRLEFAVGVLFRLLEWECSSLEQIVKRVSPADLEHLLDEHWAPRADSLPECAGSFGVDATELSAIQRKLAQRGLTLSSLRAGIVFPSRFNRMLEDLPTKADVEGAIILDLLRQQLEGAGRDCSSVVITVDRLGGRRYYRELLESLAEGAFVFTLLEEQSRSIYRFDHDGREVEVRFLVQGDRHSMPVAAASMVAKFLRERCMHAFNAYWQDEVPNVAPTAGYPGDSQRFFDAVRARIDELNIPVNNFWRSR